MKISVLHIAPLLLVAGTLSCSTEFDPVIEAPSIPVVYSLFNCYDTIQWVRLSKTFLLRGEFATSRIPKDSLSYSDARVTLERWHDDYLLARAELVREDRIREPGLFPREPNPIYVLIKNPDNQMIFTPPAKGDRVRLVIDIPDQPLIFSETLPVSSTPVSSPSREGEKIDLYSSDYPFIIEWKSQEYYQEMYLEMHYKDYYEDTAMPRKVIWREYHSIPPPLPENKNTGIKVPMTGAHMMERIAANIRDDPEVMIRTFEKIIIRLRFTDDHLYTYNLIYPIARSDMAGSVYSNIVNGYGLFGSEARSERWFTLNYRSADSLANGRYTKHLRFKNW